MTLCPLCGNRFEASENTLCSTCPLGRACNMLCCPNCGYQWPENSAALNFLKKLFSRWKDSDERTRRSST